MFKYKHVHTLCGMACIGNFSLHTHINKYILYHILYIVWTGNADLGASKLLYRSRPQSK